MEKYKRKITIDVDLLSGEITVIIDGFADYANAVKILKNAVKKIENL